MLTFYMYTIVAQYASIRLLQFDNVIIIIGCISINLFDFLIFFMLLRM